jgi:hypothetical protein
LNGVDNNEFGLGGVVACRRMIQFRTEENSMSAEFGRGGAAVNVVLKSGTNQIHGGVYEFIRNDKLDAVNFFNQGQQPFKRNQFGAFVGGPIKKNKTFIFGDYQGSRLRESQPFLSTVPTDVERTGDFSDRLTGQTFSPCGDNPAPGDPVFDSGAIFDPNTTQNYNCLNGAGTVSLRNPINPTQPNVIPANRIDATGQNVADFYPHANQPGLTNNYLANQNHVNDQDQFDIRVDHRFRDADQIFASYSFGDVRSQRPGPLGPLWGGSDCCPSISDSRAQHLGLGYTHTFSPRLLNDLHGGYFRYAVNALPFNFGKDLGVQLGIPNANRSTDPNSSGLTNIDISGFTSLGDSGISPSMLMKTSSSGRHGWRGFVDGTR